MFSRISVAAVAVGAGLATTLLAQSSPEVINAVFVLGGVEKTFDQSLTLDTAQIAAFHRPSINCDPLCITPQTAASGVQTVGERELIAFVANIVSAGEGLLIDSRDPEQRIAGYIAASVNVPTTLVHSDNPFMSNIMTAMGARV